MKRCLSCGGEVRNVYKSLWLCLKKGHVWNSHGTFETGVFGWVPDLLAEIDRLRNELAKAKAEPPDSWRPVLDWTSTTPTEPADYWARVPRLTYGPELVRLYRVDSGEMRMDDGRIVPDDLEWWGPVPRPPEKRGGSSEPIMKITIDEVRELAKRSEENDQKALAGILYAVVGSMFAGSEIKLLSHVHLFARSQLEQIGESVMSGQSPFYQLWVEFEKLREINDVLLDTCKQVLRWCQHDWSSGGIPADVTKDPDKLLVAAITKASGTPSPSPNDPAS